jgi:predicted RNA binding protein YcfA (HicA-like mRNA interferase family)
VPKIPGIPHRKAVRALEKAGFHVAREGKHVVLTDGVRIVTIPRHDPVNALTMGGIVRDAGLTVERFRRLL